MSESDNHNPFFERADAFIRTANDQLEHGVEAGQVSPAFMYGMARFTSWFCATGFQSSEDMAKSKDETMEFFMGEFRKMLEMNLDDYIQNFDQYITSTRNSQ